MAEIKTSVIINSTQEKIWEVISDIDNEPKFWKGTKEVKNISKKEEDVYRSVNNLHALLEEKELMVYD